MILPFAVHLDAIGEESDRIIEAAESGVGSAVSSCPGWTLGDLVDHTAGVLHRFAAQVRAADPTSRAEAAPFPMEPVLERFEFATDEIVAALADVGPDADCWNFTGQDLTTSFVARRLALEVAVHRFDAELSKGRANPIETELAVDGIDERLDVLLRIQLGRHPDASLGGSVCLICSDDQAAWSVEVERGRLRLRAGRGPADAAVVGTASDLYLFTWNRIDAAQLDVTGRRDVVEGWRDLPV